MLTAIGLALAGRAGTRLAAGLDLPASRAGMLRLVMPLPGPGTGTVTILGIGDFAFRRGDEMGRHAAALDGMAPTPRIGRCRMPWNRGTII